MLWYSLEAPQRGASNEYPQHMFSLRNKKNIMWIPPLICSFELLSVYWYSSMLLFSGDHKKGKREKSRECHNHKPQSFPDTKRKINRYCQTSANRTNVRKAPRLALSSPSEVIAMLKGLKNTSTYRVLGFNLSVLNEICSSLKQDLFHRSHSL